MGAIIAKLLGRKNSTRDILTKIRDDIHDIEEFKASTQAWHKKLIGYLLTYFSVIYLIAALVAYFKYFTNPAWRDFGSQLQLLTPFIIAPFIFIFLKRFLTWWYHRKIRRNEIALEKLKKQKSKILDDVMEKETYKVAKELLDEFANDAERRTLNLTRSPLVNTTNTRTKSMFEPQTKSNTSELRKRHNIPSNPSAASTSSPMKTNPGAIGSSFIASSSSDDAKKSTPPNTKRPALPNAELPTTRRVTMNTPNVMTRPAPGPPLPRPVLPRERGYMDRVVEYLVGDGPHNRYALICKQCQSHNGMALREEFEFIAYRCCYCHYWNPARKQRPTAPKLESSTLLKPQISTESSSSDDEGNGSVTQAAAANKAAISSSTEAEGKSEKPAETDVASKKAKESGGESSQDEKDKKN